MFSFLEFNNNKINKNEYDPYEERFYEACNFVTQQFETAKRQHCGQHWKNNGNTRLTMIEKEDILNKIYNEIISKLEEGNPQYIDKFLFLKDQWNNEYNDENIIIKDFLI